MYVGLPSPSYPIPFSLLNGAAVVVDTVMRDAESADTWLPESSSPKDQQVPLTHTYMYTHTHAHTHLRTRTRTHTPRQILKKRKKFKKI